MAETWLEEIYQEIKVLDTLREISQLALLNDNRLSIEKWNVVAPCLEIMCDKYKQENEDKANKLWESLVRATRNVKDLILFSDILSIEVIPKVEEYIKIYNVIDVEDDNFQLKSSQNVYLTIYDKQIKRFIHSQINPMEEARCLANQLYNPQYSDYYLLGIGLGYLAYQLFLISRQSIHLHIYDIDPIIEEYARNYGVLDWIPDEYVNVVNSKDILCFLSDYNKAENAGIYISDITLNKLDRKDREALSYLYLAYCINNSTVKYEMPINFYKNIETKWSSINKLKSKLASDNMLVVAAGPSLDQQIEYILENRDKYTIIAVGTVLRKLINVGIVPDCVAMLEARETVYKQFIGLEECKVPLIMPFCGYWKVAERYQGEKYMFPMQNCINSVRYAEERGLEIWDIGGTVSYLAIKLAVEAGAKKVALAGLDLAYPDMISHALDTPDRMQLSITNPIKVNKVGGGTIITDVPFDSFRKDIETLIANSRGVLFYNLSKIGAKINGTIEEDPIL